MLFEEEKTEAREKLEAEADRHQRALAAADKAARALGVARSRAAKEILPEIEAWINRFPSRRTLFELEKALGALRVTADAKVIDFAALDAKADTRLVDGGRFAGAGTFAAAAGAGAAAATPAALMAIATTFGTASTGTAIASLSGAAATNAALAWLGGGAVLAGGGGMAGGTAFIAAATGPVGWVVGGAVLAVGTTWAYKKAKRAADEFVAEARRREAEVRAERRTLERFRTLAEGLRGTTETANQGVTELFASLRDLAKDPSRWTQEQLQLLAALVNAVRALDVELKRDVVL
jgi:hypothetical protein